MFKNLKAMTNLFQWCSSCEKYQSCMNADGENTPSNCDEFLPQYNEDVDDYWFDFESYI